MINNDCDLAIIGAGITGLSAAIGAHFRNPTLKIKVLVSLLTQILLKRENCKIFLVGMK